MKTKIIDGKAVSAALREELNHDGNEYAFTDKYFLTIVNDPRFSEYGA